MSRYDYCSRLFFPFLGVLPILLFFLLIASPLCATVAPIVPGQSLWWIVKRIGLAIDDIESKVDLIDTSTTGAACGIVELSQSSVAGGSLAISTSGSYCLTENITAAITISASSVLLDMNGRRVTGTIQLLSGSYSTIRNGFITPPAPTSSVDPAGIDSALGVSNLSIDTVAIVCTDAGAGGGINGRTAVKIAGDDVQMRHCSLIAGAGGSIAGTGGAGGNGLLLTSDATDVVITSCTFIGGDGGDATGVQGGAGGHGIAMTGATDVSIEHCTIFRAGSGGVGSASADGGDGGHGVALLTTAANNIFIKNCTIQKSGAGGNGVDTGGAAGHGIFIASVSNAKVAMNSCTISNTGIGGNGSTDGGDGGNGVFIGSSNTDISVHNCTIFNTGAAGTGGTPTAGKAVADAVPAGAGASKVYANFAHDIANSVNYDLQGITNTERGFGLSNPPTSTAVSVYANVFI